jgi:guanylate kinase
MLEIDLQGARQVRETMPDALFVFLTPPSWEELVRRLVGRGTEDEAERERRLATAVDELAAEAEFDVSIVNHEVHASAEELVALMRLDRDPSGPGRPSGGTSDNPATD